MANHLESGGLAGRVHVSRATANCLDGAYELEPADGHLRDGYIRQAGVETFFIKQTEPSTASQRRKQQPSVVAPDEGVGEPAPDRKQPAPADQTHAGPGGGAASGQEAANSLGSVSIDVTPDAGERQQPVCLVVPRPSAGKRAMSCDESTIAPTPVAGQAAERPAAVGAHWQGAPATGQTEPARQQQPAARPAGAAQQRRPSGVRCASAQPNLAPAALGYFDDDDELEEEEEENGEDWRPEIPFMNLNALDAKPVGDSISAQLLLPRDDDRDRDHHHHHQNATTTTDRTHLGAPAPGATPEQRASRSMSSLLRNSFRRDRLTGAGSTNMAPARQPLAPSERASAEPQLAEELTLRHAHSVPAPQVAGGAKPAGTLSAQPGGCSVGASAQASKPTGAASQPGAIRRSYYRSFNVKSRNKANKKPLAAGSSFSQGTTTPSQARRLASRFTFSQRAPRAAASPQAPDTGARPGSDQAQPHGDDSAGAPSQARHQAPASAAKRRSSLVRIKIIEDQLRPAAGAEAGASQRRPSSLSSGSLGSAKLSSQRPACGCDTPRASGPGEPAGGTDSVIVSCPTSGSARSIQTSSLPPAGNRRRRHQGAGAQAAGPSGYVILFSRLFCNKLRRTGCCGFGGARAPSADAPRRRHHHQVSARRRASHGQQQRAARWSADSASFGDNSSIEVEISRRMMKEHINWFRLTFKSKALEDAYCQIRYTTSKSNIVYIFVTWLLMALVGLLSLADTWHTVKIILIATVPLSAFACFYMSDSILYNRYMNYKLKEAVQNSGQQQKRLSPTGPGPNEPSNERPTNLDPTTPNKVPERRANSSASSAAVSYGSTNTTHKVAPLVHRVAKFWSRLDRIPMIWNFFIFSFHLIMIVAFLSMNTFDCEPPFRHGIGRPSLLVDYMNCSASLGCSSPPDALGAAAHNGYDDTEQTFTCIHQENLTFSVILIMIEMGSFFRSSYLRKVILLTSMTLGFILFFFALAARHLGNQFGPIVSLLGGVLQLTGTLNSSEPGPSSSVPAVRQTIEWSLFNVAHDHSICPMTSLNSNGKPTNLSQLLAQNILSPYTLTSISQCDPNLIEKSCIIIMIVFIGLVYVCRSTERISRLDFLWKLQASKELQDMRALRHYNTQLLENILPDHVAAHFLQDERDSEELYAKSYPCVAVLFASIPNFSSFYSEDINNGMECIRLLNEIIFDFDQLLEDEQFKSIEKVKTISSTYLAACGLNPRDQSLPPSYHLSTCCNFAFAMRQALNEVNIHSFNNFVMRIGISHGPLVGGVIGAKKPVFDIWGDTVNEASRMDSTGTLDMIQVPKRSAVILETQGFRVKCRGVIPVKGKGEMETYYVIEKSSPSRLQKQQQLLASSEPVAGPGADIKIAVPASDQPASSMVQAESSATRPELICGERPLLTAPADDKDQGKAVGLSGADGDPNRSQLESQTRGKQQDAPLHQRRLLNRYSRTAQSLKDPATRRQRRSDKYLMLKSGQDLELGNFTGTDHLRASGWRVPMRSLTSQTSGDPVYRLRSASPLDLVTSDSKDRQGATSGAGTAMSSQGGANNGENSLTAVVFNMVQMRKNYDSLAKLAPGPSGTAPTGAGHHQPATNGNDLSSEAAKFVTDTINNPTATLAPALGPSRLKHGSLISRQPESASGNLTRKSTRSRASLFKRRSNYQRAGTSAISDYGPTEESIRENE